MGHLAAKPVYQSLRNRLESYPVGAPGRTTVYEILKNLYTEEEAEIASRLPLRFSTLRAISRKLKRPPAELKPKLESMAEKGLVLDFTIEGRSLYMLTPTVVGAFEFSMMRVRGDLDQKKLAGLFHRYLLEEPDFARQFTSGTKTSPFRTLVHEATVEESHAEILDWERATFLVENARRWAVGLCHCRHVAHHLNRDCQLFGMDSCLTLGPGADYLVRHGIAREISKDQARELIAQTRDRGLVHVGDNVQSNPTFICNCCGCCCELLGAFKKFEMFGNAFSSNFEASVSVEHCTGCKKCHQACPVSAIDMKDRPRTVGKKHYRFLARVDPKVCLGCGVCALQCKFDSLKMKPRPKRRITPHNTFTRVLTMALEQGKLHKLLFDRDRTLGVQAASVLVGAIINLPPTKQLLALEAVKSRFIHFLLSAARKSGAVKGDL